MKENQPAINQSSGLATAAMVLGIIAIVGSWIPIINFISIILGVLALIFGVVSLIQKRGTGKAITGIVLGALTLIIGFSLNNAISEELNGNSNANSAEESSSTSSESNSDEQAQTTFSVGEAISFDNKTVTVTSVERNWNSGNPYVTPDSGNEYVKTQVEIKNNSDNQVSYNTFDWKVQDSNGVIKDVDSTAFMVDGGLNSGELAPNGVVSGFLVFQVPAGDAGLTLQYNPSFWSDRRLEVKL